MKKYIDVQKLANGQTYYLPYFTVFVPFFEWLPKIGYRKKYFCGYKLYTWLLEDAKSYSDFDEAIHKLDLTCDGYLEHQSQIVTNKTKTIKL